MTTPLAAQLAHSPLLAQFASTNVIDAAAVLTAQRLASLGGCEDDRVLLALALAVRALEQGSVCFDPATIHLAPLGTDAAADVDLAWPDADDWTAALSSSPLVTVGAALDVVSTPLRMVDGLVYLERYWQEEESIRRAIDQRVTTPTPPLDTPARDRACQNLTEQSLQANQAALDQWLTVIAGGPGTGKTTVVKSLRATLSEVLGPGTRIALAAPTGKAAARLSESTGAEAMTLHRLLGTSPARPQPSFYPGHPLPYDVVIVDETSMVSLTAMNQLLRALRPPADDGTGARLVLVGDPDQLASVDAGAVLADICNSRVPITRLTRTWRYAGRLQDVAAAIRAADGAEVLRLLTAPVAGTNDNARLVAMDPVAEHCSDIDLRTNILSTHAAVLAAATTGDGAAALAELNRHRLLCAHRSGSYGLAAWNRRIEHWLEPRVAAQWYPGRPVLVTRNDRTLGLSNGDTGVTIATADGLRVAFDAGATVRLVAPTQLDHVETLHAMTIHKAQGSQFDKVSVVLPPTGSPLLTRELLYTALTRAQQEVTVYGTPEAVSEAVQRPASRASGLAHRLG